MKGTEAREEKNNTRKQEIQNTTTQNHNKRRLEW